MSKRRHSPLGGPFLWHRSTASPKWVDKKTGYEFRLAPDEGVEDSPSMSDALDTQGPWLIDGTTLRDLELEQFPNHETYDVFRRRTLFREFSKLDQSEEAILSFAEKYGPIYGRKSLLTCNADRQVYVSDSYNRWIWEISKMREAVELWKLLTKGNFTSRPGELHSRIIWKDKPEGVYYRDCEGRDAPIASPRSFPELWKDWSSRLDDVPPAWLHLASLVNKRLYRNMGAPLLMLPDTEDCRKLSMAHGLPFNLLGAMWLQLAHNLTGRELVKECLMCEKPLDATHDSKTTYCSPSCQMRAYRIRIAVTEKGFSPGKIASKRGMSLDRVLRICLRGISRGTPITKDTE